MVISESQLRTTNNRQALIGYRADYRGERVIAIMKGNNPVSLECIGFIYPEELMKLVESGPCINIDNLLK